MKVVLLAGGLGSRLGEETSVRPKPMVEIGHRPILWHIMQHYSHFGHREFIVCLGYKGEHIKRYFADSLALGADVTIDFATNSVEVLDTPRDDWRVTLVDTGQWTQTGGRLSRVQSLLGDEPFLMTYGDGVSDVDLDELVAFHQRQGRLATVTAVRPPARFGKLTIDDGRGHPLRREAADVGRAGSTAASSSWSPACSTTSPATSTSPASRWRASPPPASSAASATRGSGSAWTPSATRTCSTRCGTAGSRRGRCGSRSPLRRCGAATSIDGVFVMTPRLVPDERGWFTRTLDLDWCRDAGLDADFVQHNQSRSHRAVLRGLHVRGGRGETKLVRCARGAVVDYVVDTRPWSPTFRRVERFELDDVDASPPATCRPFIAHGFQVVSDEADVCYLHSRPYEPGCRARRRLERPVARAGLADRTTDPVRPRRRRPDARRDRPRRRVRTFLTLERRVDPSAGDSGGDGAPALEGAAGGDVRGLLGDDLVGEVPREQQDVVGSILERAPRPAGSAAGSRASACPACARCGRRRSRSDHGRSRCC